MSQFAVHRNRNTATKARFPLLLDVQVDLLEELGKCQRPGLRCTLDIVNAGRDCRERDDREDRQHHEAWAAEARWQHELHPFREVQP